MVERRPDRKRRGGFCRRCAMLQGMTTGAAAVRPRGMAGLPDNSDRIAMRDSAGDRLALIARSFAEHAGRELVETAADDLEEALWSAPQAIVAHGTEPRPLFFYGNRVALTLFEMRAAEFIGLPSERSAEPAARDARARMLAELARTGIVEGYSGVRVAASGRRFTILGASVWNLREAGGEPRGQAAMFAEWRFLD